MVPNQIADGVKGCGQAVAGVVGTVQNEMGGERLDHGKTEYDEAYGQS
jgi:hypothetical protein